MIDKLNIPLENKETKKIFYTLWLDGGTWCKTEINAGGLEIYYESSLSYWYKFEYDVSDNIYILLR